jgi:hypothetical protein
LNLRAIVETAAPGVWRRERGHSQT